MIKNVPFGSVRGRKIEVDFSGGQITSNAGILLLKKASEKTGILEEVARVLNDPRDQTKVLHSIYSMLGQRVYGIALGYEDLNDHEKLRSDYLLQSAVNRDEPLAGDSTLNRFEQWANRETAWRIHGVIFEKFIASYEEPPKSIILDFDATDHQIFGNQEGKHYNKYYHGNCFLPLHVFCGSRPLVSYLRPSSRHGSYHAAAILKILVMKIREIWPDVEISFRGDAGFQKPYIYHWCEKNGVTFITGVISNTTLRKKACKLMLKAEKAFQLTGEDKKFYAEFSYQAESWSCRRRVIVKAEYNEKGPNTRFIVTNQSGTPENIYKNRYCARGDMENRIQEHKVSLSGKRTSCKAWYANQFRILLSTLAYILVDTIRQAGLKKTGNDILRCCNLRLKLLKIGAVVVRTSRKLKVCISTSYPLPKIFTEVAAALTPI